MMKALSCRGWLRGLVLLGITLALPAQATVTTLTENRSIEAYVDYSNVLGTSRSDSDSASPAAPSAFFEEELSLILKESGEENSDVVTARVRQTSHTGPEGFDCEVEMHTYAIMREPSFRGFGNALVTCGYEVTFSLSDPYAYEFSCGTGFDGLELLEPLVLVGPPGLVFEIDRSLPSTTLSGVLPAGEYYFGSFTAVGGNSADYDWSNVSAFDASGTFKLALTALPDTSSVMPLLGLSILALGGCHRRASSSGHVF